MKNIKNIIKAGLFTFVLLGVTNLSAAASAPDIIKLSSGNNSEVVSVCFSPDGKYIAAGYHSDCTVKIWDIETGNCINNFSGHTASVRSVKFNSDATLVASGSMDGTVRLWDIKTGDCKILSMESNTQVFSVSFSPNDQFLAIGLADGHIILWDLTEDRCVKYFKSHTTLTWSLAFDRSGEHLASASTDKKLKVWDLETDNCTEIKGGIGPVAFSPNGEFLAYCTNSLLFPGCSMFFASNDDYTIKLRNITTNKRVQKFSEKHRAVINSIGFNSTGTMLVSGSYDTTICIWDVESGNCIGTFSDYENNVNSVSFSPNNQQIAAGLINGDILIIPICMFHEKLDDAQLPKPKIPAIIDCYPVE